MAPEPAEAHSHSGVPDVSCDRRARRGEGGAHGRHHSMPAARSGSGHTVTSVHRAGRDVDPTPDRLPAAGWFVASFLAYIACGLVFHTLVLNWVVGPAWLVVTLFALPTAWRRLVRAVRR